MCAAPFSLSFCRAVGLTSFRNSSHVKSDTTCKYFIPTYLTTLPSFTPAGLYIYIYPSFPFCFWIVRLSQETSLPFPGYEGRPYVFFFYIHEFTSLIDLEFIFLYGVRNGIDLLLSYTNIFAYGLLGWAMYLYKHSGYAKKHDMLL